MDAFRSLTIGTKFSAARNGEAAKLFRNAGKDKGSRGFPDAIGADGAVALENASDMGSSSLSVPPPSATLNLFGRPTRSQADANAHLGISGGSDAVAAANTASDDKALKAITFKKKRNIWRRNDLQVTGTDLPAPIEHFSDLVRPPLSVPRNVVNNLFVRQHKVPTPIQMQAISSLIHHRDVLACAPTGSGKTIAFLVPLFALLKAPDASCGVRALIVTPTAELAQQIEREAFFLMKGQRWKFVQHGQTTKNKDIFIATPGRIVSLLEQKLLDLSNVQYLVFDEGDRLWDSRTDFLTVIDRILTACTRTDKVVSLFTATLSEKVEAAARSVMGADPVRIIVHGRRSANTHVKQRLIFCGNELGKVVAMRNLVREGITPPVLVFVQSVERSKELYEEIRAEGLHMAIMHAKMTVEQREETVLQFRLGKIWVLVTTELLARGIDFKNVGTVINFDFPATVDSYIHRVGRTGRAGKEGTAITFFTEDDKERLPPIAKVMQDSGNAVEDWILGIKVDRSTRRRLERTTPQRTIVSTRKRMLVAQQRMQRQYRRLEAEENEKKAARKASKRRKGRGDCERNDGDDSMDDE
ncbi:putative ATP-dependent RNA helicase-like protein [Leishmania infantum JPCM5]|uniref:RNA helicase n=4 Tax=Leishmania donovani species complex TaxID=38574 RepID=A4I7M5_LEIIN|nr:putative ATP-dependent RNA helicase-like protein [Leishmania infantum JPCM5]XP_003863478.1 ATP-dependent RNA helicase-like protein, putative [Leishmania donovani]CAC9523407.1 ATP-dependent_DEAD/H_RNA_helicase_-_putative [Leishmania infantum]TPP43573.1 DEAD/DEAH box helicase family protein [Leishmania donovani]CAM70809.1 putative ATP-dependent RNA helicase-like protein [Leishmania infantum JPCM5]CBZ36792.1 ATP-dependent RNA helicase-like protein, putative [Leishmania donovani]SUZ44624.1 ATP|eukprot:XP_001467744.1 putative ATP-dependent RNA helicase-like protein [Leishmania infantum JPCM5]